MLWLLSGLYPRSAVVTGVCFAGAFLSAGSAKQHRASWTRCLDSLCPSSPPHFPCIYEKSEHTHTLSPELHTAAVLYQPCCIHFSSLSRHGHAQNQTCSWSLCWGLHPTPLKLAYVLPGLVIPLRVHEKLLMEPVTF